MQRTDYCCRPMKVKNKTEESKVRIFSFSFFFGADFVAAVVSVRLVVTTVGSRERPQRRL